MTLARGRRTRPSWIWFPASIAAGLALAAAALLGLAGPTPVACAAGPGAASTMLRFLVVAPDGPDATTAYWRDALGRAGVPYDVLVPSKRAPLTFAGLARGTSGRYQAVVVARSALGALAPGELAALEDYERRFAVRRISSGPESPSARADPLNAQTLSGTAWLTREGRRVFPGLRGPVPVSDARVAGRALGSRPAGSVLLRAGTTPLLSEVRHPDGRQELVDGLVQDPERLHSQLLAPGLIAWASRGVHLGLWRHHLSVQVDDVLLAAFLWDRRAKRPGRPGRAGRVIMTPADVDRAASWSDRAGLRLDLGINASGAESHGGDCTELGQAVIAHRDDFGFFNHTYEHLNLDDAAEGTIVAEIGRNAAWARRNGIPLDPAEVVTGEHSGLANPELPSALRAAGVRWIAADAADSLQVGRRGPAITVPRYPSNIYFDVATRAELLDQYNHRYVGGCRRPVSCLPRPATWDELLRDETGRLLRLVLGNDPRPLFVHQNNLAAQGTLYPFLDEVLRAYRRSVRAALLQPRLAETGRDLLRWRRFRERREGLVAWRAGDRLFLHSPRAVEVPITGLRDGALYGGRRSGWVTVPAGVKTILPVG